MTGICRTVEPIRDTEEYDNKVEATGTHEQQQPMCCPRRLILVVVHVGLVDVLDHGSHHRVVETMKSAFEKWTDQYFNVMYEVCIVPLVSEHTNVETIPIITRLNEDIQKMCKSWDTWCPM